MSVSTRAAGAVLAASLIWGGMSAAPAEASDSVDAIAELDGFDAVFTLAESHGESEANLTISNDDSTQVTGLISGDASEPIVVQADIPAKSAEPITLSAGGQPVLSLDIPGSRSAARQLTDQTAAFDHGDGFVATAVDATTIETFHVAADASGPTEFRSAVNLLPGQSLKTNGEGLAAVVDASGAPVVFVEAPEAIDADGRTFPVHLSIEGSEVVIEFDHGAEDVAYPILIDPIWYYAGYEYILNADEFSYCKWPSRWGLCKAMFDHSNTAGSAASSSDLPGAHNGRQDAFRHCYWSARMRIGHGYDKAKEFGDRHEQTKGQPATEKDMDLKNNSIGRGVGAGRTYAGAKAECLRLAKAGGLYVIRNGRVMKG